MLPTDNRHAPTLKTNRSPSFCSSYALMFLLLPLLPFLLFPFFSLTLIVHAGGCEFASLSRTCKNFSLVPLMLSCSSSSCIFFSFVSFLQAGLDSAGVCEFTGLSRAHAHFFLSRSWARQISTDRGKNAATSSLRRRQARRYQIKQGLNHKNLQLIFFRL